ncbi:MAG: erythromycin esterase family protein [Heyndrickxia sp.]
MVKRLQDAINRYAKKITGPDDFTPLLQAVGDAKFVLLGESSHGTSEFYQWRTALTKKLIMEKGFSIIAVEGDWPACQAVNSYIKGYDTESGDSKAVLCSFQRWPTWMWANEEINELVQWLRTFNESNASRKKVGFYGLDVYSLWESMDAMIQYLEKKNSPDLGKAKQAFSCFEPFNRQSEKYAVSASFFSEGCVDEVIELLTTIRCHKENYHDGMESSLNMEVNALVAANAEEYYRTMVVDDVKSWNIRDEHMVEALNAIRKFYGQNEKVIVWEHNTHVGDARATDMKEEGMLNVGQILREQNREQDVFVIGFGTYQGTVIAAKEWGANVEVVTMPPAEKDSWEDILHRAGPFDKYILFNEENRELFSRRIGHRAIGVVYDPRYEIYGNYVPSEISNRYDSFIFLDQTTALHPLAVEVVYQ